MKMLRITKIKDNKTLDLLCEKYNFKKIYSSQNGELIYLKKHIEGKLLFSTAGSMDIYICTSNGNIEIESLEPTNIYVKSKRRDKVIYQITKAQHLLCEFAIKGIIQIEEDEKSKWFGLVDW